MKNNEGPFSPLLPYSLNLCLNLFCNTKVMAFLKALYTVLLKIMIINATNLRKQEINTFTCWFLPQHLLCHKDNNTIEINVWV